MNRSPTLRDFSPADLVQAEVHARTQGSVAPALKRELARLDRQGDRALRAVEQQAQKKAPGP